MRRILVDHARAKNAEKRGGGRRVELDVGRMANAELDPRIEELDEALNRLAAVEPNALPK